MDSGHIAVPDSVREQVREYEKKLEEIDAEARALEQRRARVKNAMQTYLCGCAQMAAVPDDWEFDRKRWAFFPQSED